MEKQKKAYIYAAVAILFWSTVASAFKKTLRSTDPLTMLFYASLTSTIVFLVCLSALKKLHLLKTLSKKDYLLGALLGLLNPFAYYIVLFEAYKILPAQQAQPLNYLWPIMLVLLSIPLLKQKITIKSFLAILISFGGALVIATQGSLYNLKPTNPLGVSLAMGSSIIWALFWIYNIRQKHDEVLCLFLNFSFGTVFIFILMLLLSKFTTPSAPAIIGSIYVGLFEMGITFIFWLKALKVSEKTAYVANLIYIAPFLSLVIIHFTVGEQILPSTIIGLALIIIGISIQKKQ
ncbi:DMT family transporter [Planctomycetota bacterium]